MSENWKIQVSPKLTDGTLINLRAETPEEADKILNWAVENAAKIGSAVKAVNAVSLVGGQLGGAVVDHQPPQGGPSWSQQGSQQAPPQFAQQQAAPAASAGAGKKCVHGDMVYRSGNKNGRDWQAYFCPTPRGTPNQCQPEFVR